MKSDVSMYVCICEIVSAVRRVPIHPLPVSSCPFETPASHPFLLLHLQVNTGFPFEWPILHYFWGEVESRYFFSFIGVIYIIILASFVEKTVKLHWRLCYKLIERVCRLISELSPPCPAPINNKSIDSRTKLSRSRCLFHHLLVWP